MWDARQNESQTGIKIAGRNINNLSYADNTTLVADTEEKLKSLVMRVKKESEKAGLILNIYKTKIMASSPITSWQIDEEKVETVANFIFLVSKITEDGDCSHEIKRRLLFGRKTVTNLDRNLKSRDITLLKKVHIVKAIFFSVVMYKYESWTIKKSESKELMLSNYGTGEGSWESLGLQGVQTNQLWMKSTLNIHWKNWCWSWSSNILAIRYE